MKSTHPQGGPSYRLHFVFVFASLLFFTLLLFFTHADTATGRIGDMSPSPQARLKAAWQLAGRLGQYNFRTEMEQITYPAASLSNVGRSPQHDFLYSEGKVDQAVERVELSLWQGNSPQEASNRLEMRIDHGQTYVRLPKGDAQEAEWQRRDDLSTSLLPNGDPLAFLQAIQKVTAVGSRTVSESLGESLGESEFVHYTFELDGMALAEVLRTQLEQALRASGDLPANVRLQASEIYQKLVGRGEIWLERGATGDDLPVRMILELAFPQDEQGNQIAATLKSDFSGFDRAKLAPLSTAWARTSLALGLPQNTDAWQRLGGAWFLCLLSALALVLLIRYGRSRWVYTAIVSLIILSTLLTPLLQAQRLYAFSEKMAQRAASPDMSGMSDASDKMESTGYLPQLLASARGEQETGLATAPAAPHNRLLSAPAVQATNPDGPDGDNDGLSDADETILGSNPHNTDSDADTLPDGVEVTKLGTNPASSDSDSDGLSDPKEVAGFTVKGTPWYTSPIEADSNLDGLPDGVDCAGQSSMATTPTDCPDSDSDGTPDLFDEDNDGDGVSDQADFSPYAVRGQGAPFGRNQPFPLRVDGLQANQPVYVNLQIRPTDPSHLNQAMNVLDWPANDSQGNIRRYLDTTFADTANLSIRANDPAASNGDMRLIPMISIQIPKPIGSYGNLPVKPGAAPLTANSTITDFENALDQNLLDAYSMSVLRADENTLEILAPATLDTDPLGNARTAFSSHLLFQSSADGSWGSDHQVRLLWLVQMIIDVCNDPKQEGTAFCDKPENRHDELTVIHTYSDDFIVTGMNVEEHHGMDLAILFENPANDPDTTLDNRLWHLGYGLMNTFAHGSDENHNNTRDLSISEIERRWKSDSTASDSERWQVPVGATAVVSKHYPHPDYMAHVMMTDTVSILNTYFLNGSTPRAASPTLLFARERSARSSTLPAGTLGNVSLSSVPIQVYADLSWAPYRYNVQHGWENDPIVDYANALRTRLGSDAYFIPVDTSSESQSEAHTRLTLATALYLALYQGYGNLVQQDSTPIVTNSSVSEGGTNGLENQPSDSPLSALHHVMEASHESLHQVYTLVNSEVSLIIGERYYKTFGGKALSKGLGVATAVIFASALLLVEAEAGHDSQAFKIASATIAAVGVVAATATAVRTYTLARAAAAGATAAEAATKYKIMLEKTQSSAKGLILGLAIVWGTYIYSATKGGLGFDDPQLLAQTTATTIFMILLFILDLIPVVGSAINLFLIIFDGLAMIICAIMGKSGGLCGGLSGLITEALGKLFFEVDTFVDMEDPHRLSIDYVLPTILHRDMGMIPGNEVNFSVAFTNALKADGDFLNKFTGRTNNEGKIRESTFAYSLSLSEQTIKGLQLGQMHNTWITDYTLQRYTYHPELNQVFPLGVYGTGANVPYYVYLNEGYVVPYEECYTFFGLATISCKTRSMDGHSSINVSEAVVYDILPTTFAEFTTLQRIGDAYHLGWGGIGQANFPLLVDADGDGLRSKHVGGSDPDDGKTDSDGDALSDFFEHEWGSRPDKQDTDGDGLSDREELRYSTDPIRADSDYDGLGDKEEREGWEFIYGFNGANSLRTWVRADPLAADPDHDDIFDADERRFGFHPRVASDGIVMSYAAAVRNPSLPSDAATEGVYAKAGQTLHYDAQIGNALNNRHIYGQLTTVASGPLSTNSNPQNFFLLPTEQISRSQTVQVSGNAPSGLYHVSQQARGDVDDPRTPTQQAIVYWSFDNERPLLDLSGALPSSNLLCTPATCPLLNTAGKIGNGADFTQNMLGNKLQALGLVEKLNESAFYSLGGWLYPQSSGGADDTMTFFSFNNNTYDQVQAVRYDVSNQKFVYVDPVVGKVSSNRTFAINQWHHVMLVINSGASNNGQLYVDGVAEASFSTSARPTSDLLFHLGSQLVNSTPSDPWYGKIDEVKLFNRALTANEVAESMEVVEPVIDASWDNWQQNNEDGDDISYFDRNGNREIVRCQSSCPSLVQTPWGTGVHAGRLEIPFTGFTNLRHKHYSLALRVKPTQMPDEDFFYDFIGYLPESSYGYPEVPSVGYGYNGQIRVYFNPNNVFLTDPGVLVYNQWHQVVVTFDGATMTVYVNGQQVGSTSILTGYPVADYGDGSMLLSSSNDFAQLDELQVFNYTLSTNQIKRIFGAESYMEAHLRFEDVPGTTRFANQANRAADGFCSSAANACPISNISGRIGQAVDFTTLNQQIDIHKQQINAPMLQTTVAAWVKGRGTVLWRDPDLSLTTSNVSLSVVDPSSGSALTHNRALQIPSDKAVDSSVWTHIAMTFNGVPGAYYDEQGRHPFAQIHLYVNGQEVAADLDGPVGSLASSSNPWQVGGNFFGQMDDLRIYRTVMSPAEIQQLYTASAAALWLRLDEEEGATSFVERAVGLTTHCVDTCPQSGHKGRMGGAASFTNGGVEVGAASDLLFNDASSFSISAWVKPTEGTATLSSIQPIVSKGQAADSNTQGQIYALQLAENKPQFTFGALQVTAAQSLTHNVWTHLVATYQNHQGRLFVNGQLAAESNVAPALSLMTPQPVAIGAQHALLANVPGQLRFNGQIDEVMIHRSALSAQAVKDIYEDQSGWVEERSRFEVTVDNEPPTTTIRSALTYLANQPTILDVYADDPTSPLYKVELLTNDQASNAPHCLGAKEGAAFCPTFTPNGEGRYTLQSRATDIVGNQQRSPLFNLLVDTSAPTLTLSAPLPPSMKATPSSSELQRWVITLAGTVNDPTLSSGDAGSGVETLQLTIYDPEGALVGAGTQDVDLDVDLDVKLDVNLSANGTWQHDYIFYENPDGLYRIEATITDKVGNQRTLTLGSVTFDGQAPALAVQSILPSYVISDPITISGVVTDAHTAVRQVEIAYIPTDLGSTHYNDTPIDGLVAHLALEDDAGVTVTHDLSGNDHDGFCVTCPRFAVRGQHGNGAFFDGVDDSIRLDSVSQAINGGAFSMGAMVYVASSATNQATVLAFNRATDDDLNQVFYDASTQRFVYFDPAIGAKRSSHSFAPEQWHHLFLTIDGANNGILYIDGVQEITFNTPVRPSADARFSIGQEWDADTASDFFVGTLDEVHLYQRALSSAEIRQLLHNGEPALWLDFEEAWVTDGMTLTGRGGWRQQIVVSSGEPNNLATVGIVGNQALRFDGIDDGVTVAFHPALDLSQGQFSEAVWLFPDGNDAGEHLILGGNPTEASGAQRYASLYLYEQTKLHYGFGNGSQWLYGVTGSVITPNAWNFVVATFDGTDYRIYVNGQLVHTDSSLAGQKPYPTIELRIGGQENPLRGAVDELRIYPRTLSLLEVQSLYRQGWQQVSLAANASQTNWTTNVPDGMEGLYEIALRASDSLGNVSGHRPVWRGVIDNLAPRLITPPVSPVTRNLVEAASDLQHFTVEDFHLVEDNFSTFCGNGQVAARTHFNSAWRVAFAHQEIGDGGRLFQLRAACLPGTLASHLNACDAYGNCTTQPLPPTPTSTPVPTHTPVPTATPTASPTPTAAVTPGATATPAVQAAYSVGIDPNTCATAGSLVIPPKTAVYYCLKIQNNSNAAITRLGIVDAQLGLSVTLNVQLPPAASLTLTHRQIAQFGPLIVTGDIKNVLVITPVAGTLAEVSGETQEGVLLEIIADAEEADAASLLDATGLAPIEARVSIWIDSDRDTIPDSIEGSSDPDQDGLPNWLDTDSNGNGISDGNEAGGDVFQAQDQDQDRVPDYLDTAPSDASKGTMIYRFLFPVAGR